MGSSLWLKIVEVVGVRSFQDDKFEAKIVEVDYEIPPKVGMTNCTQKKIFRFSKIRGNPSPQSKQKKIRYICVPKLCVYVFYIYSKISIRIALKKSSPAGR
jgi:CRISPR/Cas system-associated protein Cas5 (RAMP superfamily)